MDNYFNNTSLIGLIMRWRFHLLVITILAAILGAVFSGSAFITPLYKSEAVAYPANINSYSDESETEQMLQLLQSQDITDSIINIFNLLDHYKIDPKYKYMRTALLAEYSQNVKIRKTPYEAISINVRDKDPEIASSMANKILDLYNEKVASLHKGKYKEVVDMYEEQLVLKNKLIDSLQERLYVLGNEYGLIDYSAQSQEIMRGYLRTVYGTNLSNINTKGVTELKGNIEKHGGELLTVTEMLQHEARTYVEIKLDLEQAQRFLRAKLTYSNIITKAYPSDKKAFPIRWVIVVFSALSAFLLSVLVIFILENKSKLVDQKS